MSKSSKRPMKSWFNAKNAAACRRQRNREYTTMHEEDMAAKREEQQLREMEAMKRGGYCRSFIFPGISDAEAKIIHALMRQEE